MSSKDDKPSRLVMEKCEIGSEGLKLKLTWKVAGHGDEVKVTAG